MFHKNFSDNSLQTVFENFVVRISALSLEDDVQTDRGVSPQERCDVLHKEELKRRTPPSFGTQFSPMSCRTFNRETSRKTRYRTIDVNSNQTKAYSGSSAMESPHPREASTPRQSRRSLNDSFAMRPRRLFNDSVPVTESIEKRTGNALPSLLNSEPRDGCRLSSMLESSKTSKGTTSENCRKYFGLQNAKHQARIFSDSRHVSKSCDALSATEWDKDLRIAKELLRTKKCRPTKKFRTFPGPEKETMELLRRLRRSQGGHYNNHKDRNDVWSPRLNQPNGRRRKDWRQSFKGVGLRRDFHGNPMNNEHLVSAKWFMRNLEKRIDKRRRSDRPLKQQSLESGTHPSRGNCVGRRSSNSSVLSRLQCASTEHGVKFRSDPGKTSHTTAPFEKRKRPSISACENRSESFSNYTTSTIFQGSQGTEEERTPSYLRRPIKRGKFSLDKSLKVNRKGGVGIDLPTDIKMTDPSKRETPKYASSSAGVEQRQRKPCYFFNRGKCLRGDRCRFLHLDASAKINNCVPSVSRMSTHSRRDCIEEGMGPVYHDIDMLSHEEAPTGNAMKKKRLSFNAKDDDDNRNEVTENRPRRRQIIFDPDVRRSNQ